MDIKGYRFLQTPSIYARLTPDCRKRIKELRIQREQEKLTFIDPNFILESLGSTSGGGLQVVINKGYIESPRVVERSEAPRDPNSPPNSSLAPSPERDLDVGDLQNEGLTSEVITKGEDNSPSLEKEEPTTIHSGKGYEKKKLSRDRISEREGEEPESAKEMVKKKLSRGKSPEREGEERKKRFIRNRSPEREGEEREKEEGERESPKDSQKKVLSHSKTREKEREESPEDGEQANRMAEVSFIALCYDTARTCKGISERYSRWLTILRFIAGTLCACAGLIGGLLNAYGGIAAGALGTILNLLDVYLKWGFLSEKYAHLALEFKRLSLSKDPNKWNKYKDLKLLAESSVLESDLS